MSRTMTSVLTYLEELVDVDGARAIEVHQLKHAIDILQLAIRWEGGIYDFRPFLELFR
jgi:hypothetical protein